MCNIDDPPASAVVAEQRNYKQQSLNDPDGVQFMDHLWQMIEDIDQPLTVVLRTDQDVFDDVPVKVFWQFISPHGIFHSTLSRLIFDLPDEVCRRIQSRHAQEVRTRYFGDTTPVTLLEVFRPDKQRDVVRTAYFSGYADEPTIIQDDWSVLKEAIRLTAQDLGGYIGGQSVTIADSWSLVVSLARVNGNHLELLITPQLVSRINQHWNKELGSLLGVSNKHL
ncbi:MAG TPA: hypothetical protein VF281_04995 [Candidatus Saccharimonadales bacterium]